MPQSSTHCPFLNQSDQRCSAFFNLDQLPHAYQYCFDRYTTCPVYDEQLHERQTRRQGAVIHVNPFVEITISAAAAVGVAAGVSNARRGTARYAQSQRAAA
ncbi:MAG: hypothetical protein ABIP55_00585 [Tepidisphaeraceae bacterium]